MSKTQATTLAERLEIIQAKFPGTFERIPTGETVRVLYTLDKGDRLSGEGLTTADAVAALEAKLEKIGNAL